MDTESLGHLTKTGHKTGDQKGVSSRVLFTKKLPSSEILDTVKSSKKKKDST